MEITALDLFAGTGWGVACKRLGIEEMGVEIMPEACETRRLNGMETVYHDVWDGLKLSDVEHEMFYGEYQLLIASPPCQTFSAAGNGAGRRALNEVIEAIQAHAYKDPAELHAFGEKHDPRTALVLSPLAYIWRDRPRYVALEQVPTVLPVWQEYAAVMRGWGYDVETAVLNAEQYGIPQTRRRAILVASLTGPAVLPMPTHSRYYSRTPEKLDPGVRKWVSMAEALGWGRTDAPVHTVTGGVHGPTDRWASGGNNARKAMDAAIGGPNWLPRTDTPETDGRTKYADRFDVEEVATIQTYPTAHKNMGRGMVERYGERPGRDGTEPAFTVRASAGGTEPGGFILREADGTERKLDQDEAAALQTFPARPEWAFVRPSTTIMGDPRIAAAGHHDHHMEGAYRATQAEAHRLRTFPEEPPFQWAGTKSKVFLQIGNAVPPLLAQRILEALLENDDIF